MSRYRIEITRDALRTLAKLDKPIRRRVQASIDKLGEQSRPPGVISLQGFRGAYRLRVGNYRVIYTIEDDRLMVLVVDLDHRREIYPRSVTPGFPLSRPAR